MKKILFLLFFSCAGLVTTLAQDAKFSVSVSSDSVLLGNYIKVTFQIENTSVDNFEPPTFEGFKVVSGPNVSSSFSIINGVSSQSASYTYYLEPQDIGNYYLTPASVVVGEETLETKPVEVIVLPNPDGIIEHPDRGSRQPFEFFQTIPAPQTPMTPKKKKKKKRKIYKL